MPPLTPTSVQQYSGLIVKSRLMSADEVKSAQNRWKESGKNEFDVEGFRKSLVAAKQLSEYQAALLNRGHTEGYFLGEYRIVDLIGKGRMAGVYRAVHQSGQMVAIKVLPPSKAREGQLLARFQREAKLLLKLNHPNVVRAFGVGETNGRHYFAMEALEGDTLDEVLEKRKKLPSLEAIRIAYQTLLGLQHIHDKKMIHRDIKPANLMLTPGPLPKDDTFKSNVKILDIGLGRSVFEEIDPAVEPETQLTGENVLLGTPDYLAPEQAHSARDADIRADIYSVGCTLYHCLTGQPPFPDTNVLTQVLRHATETARPLSDFIQPVPEGLQQVLGVFLAKDAGHRYQTPERAAQALEVFLKVIPEATRKAAATPIRPDFQQWLQVTGQFEPARGPNEAAANLGVAPTQPMPKIATPPAPTARTLDYREPPPQPMRPVPAPIVEPLPPSPAPVPNAQGVQPAPKTDDWMAALKKERSTPPGEVLPTLEIDPGPAFGDVEEFDVEIVRVEAPPPAQPAPEPAEKRRRKPDDPRPLTELNRRDVIMISLGAGAVVGLGLAVWAGYALSHLGKKRDPDPPVPPSDEKKDEPDTKTE